MSYTCQNCGASAEDSSKLCHPASEEQSSNLCGVPADKVCNGKITEMKYSCDACGSVSASPGNLCSPSAIR